MKNRLMLMALTASMLCLTLWMMVSIWSAYFKKEITWQGVTAAISNKF